MRKYKDYVKKTAYLILFLFFILLFYSNSFLLVVKAEEGYQQNVLILNSYHGSLNWTHEESDGIINGLRSNGKNVSISVEYMDWKNFNSKENLDYLYEYYKFKYQNKHLDLIITTDDAALNFALEYRKVMFSDAPIVFSGVNFEGIRTLIRDQTNVTGVAEEIDPIETLRMAVKVNPLIDEIYLLYDNSESGLSTGQLMNETIHSFNPNIKIVNWNNLSFNEVLNEVKNLNQNSIVYMTTYSSDINNTVYDIDFVTKEVCSLSSVPVYGLYDFALGHGIIGGQMLSGRLQGEYAARIANRILSGEDPSDIPVLYTNTTSTAFDYNQLIRFNIPLDMLPKDSEIINQPFSFYQTYKTLVLSVTGVFLLITIFVFILLFYIKKLRKMKKDLNLKNEELSQLYEELVASDEELRDQYDKMVHINEKIRLSDDKLKYLAYHDALTGLPNKLSLYEYMDSIDSTSANGKALFFIDIDNFKFVNDTLGHNYGDKLLIQFSDKINRIIKDDGTLYRLNGDEFIILFEQADDIGRVENFAKKLLDDFSGKDNDINVDIRISFSIGIAIAPIHGDNLEELIKYADIAMYNAKKQGKNRYVVYNEALKEIFMERITIEKYLSKALDNEEFELYFQPQLDIKNNKIAGLEALLRWNSPDLGHVSPKNIIDVAEETHFIIPLGKWILNKACEFLKTIKEKGYEGLKMSINISILQLLQDNFIEQLLNTLNKYDLYPEDIELEITETILVESFDEVSEKLHLLREKNINIALDDFGKGYSSLSYLKQLPIKTMKIDKSFIDDILKEDDKFLSYVIALGKELGMCVVAEGVEDEKQLTYLKEHNCDIIQGYLFSRPKPGEYILEFLNQLNARTQIKPTVK
ncbi:MAG: EAL domain-containing protein [Anaerolineaceae bacterium]|nr:MAG: EAL domain-containing protein [Anaerolineaceae bacterium]